MAFLLIDTRANTVAESMRKHVRDRGGLSLGENGEPVIPNGAWAMMLEAAEVIDALRAERDRLIDEIDTLEIRHEHEKCIDDRWIEAATKEAGFDEDTKFDDVWTQTLHLARQAQGLLAAQAAGVVPVEHHETLKLIDEIRAGLPRVTRGPWKSMSASQPIDDFSHGLVAEGYGAVGYWKGHKSFHADNMWVLTKADSEHIARLNPVEMYRFVGLIDYLLSATTFQSRFQTWVITALGEEEALCRLQRNHRLLEETLELVQAAQLSRSDAHHLVDYVYDRPFGEIRQEVGGVITTLAAFCSAYAIDMMEAGEAELARVWANIDKVRDKQRQKPTTWAVPV